MAKSTIYIFNFVGEISAHRHATSLGIHSRCDVHTCQFLEKQFGSVRNVNLRNSGLVLARAALELPSRQVAEQNTCQHLDFSLLGCGQLTQWVSSNRKSRKHALCRHLIPRTTALSGTHWHRVQSCNRVPSHRIADHHLLLYPPMAVG